MEYRAIDRSGKMEWEDGNVIYEGDDFEEMMQKVKKKANKAIERGVQGDVRIRVSDVLPPL